MTYCDSTFCVLNFNLSHWVFWSLKCILLCPASPPFSLGPSARLPKRSNCGSTSWGTETPEMQEQWSVNLERLIMITTEVEVPQTRVSEKFPWAFGHRILDRKNIRRWDDSQTSIWSHGQGREPTWDSGYLQCRREENALLEIERMIKGHGRAGCLKHASLRFQMSLWLRLMERAT